MEWNRQPCDYETVCRVTSELGKDCSYFQRQIYGKSLCRRELILLSAENHAETERQRVLIAAAFHGMEWITTAILLHFAQRLSFAAERGETLQGIDAAMALRRSRPIFVPCVNPDGVEIQLHGMQAAEEYAKLVEQVSHGDTEHWQTNARGVDINHNFNAHWHRLRQMEEENGICGPAKTRYGGEFPESEPESHCLAELTRHSNVGCVLALHSQGEEIYHGFDGYVPPNSMQMAQRLAQVSGYTLAQPEGLASCGGFKDWFVCKFGRPGFTIELGKGVNPLPIAQFDEIYRKAEPMLMQALLL